MSTRIITIEVTVQLVADNDELVGDNYTPRSTTLTLDESAESVHDLANDYALEVTRLIANN